LHPMQTINHKAHSRAFHLKRAYSRNFTPI
jgi:hypothetical protein